VARDERPTRISAGVGYHLVSLLFIYMILIACKIQNFPHSSLYTKHYCKCNTEKNSMSNVISSLLILNGEAECCIHLKTMPKYYFYILHKLAILSLFESVSGSFGLDIHLTKLNCANFNYQ